MIPAEVKPQQILYLAHQKTRLYAEAIQIIPDRQLCWARPLALFTGDPAIHPDLCDPIDLRQTSDLLLPLSWFQLALDTEAMPLLAHLHHAKLSPYAAANDCLRSFINQLFQAQRQERHYPV